MAADLAHRLDEHPNVPADLVAATRATLAGAKAPSTRRAYRIAWAAFQAWCACHNLGSLPAAPETLALYITHLARTGRKIATIERALVAISQAHEMAKHDSPRRNAIVRETCKGLRKRFGVAPDPKAPMVVETLTTALERLPKDLRGVLYRALLLVGFAGAFRRSELVAMDVHHIEFTPEGAKVLIPRSKTDQEGRGRKVALLHGEHEERCPVRALRAWLDASRITHGPVFRAVDKRGDVVDRRLCDVTVARVVKRAAVAAGLDPRSFAGHSLRSGFATSAARAGKTELAIMRVTGHRSVEMVHRYVREANLFRDHAAEGIGL